MTFARVAATLILVGSIAMARAADTAAIVSRVDGSAVAKRESKSVRLAALDEVRSDDSIDVPAGATLVLIALASGSELSFKGPATVSFDASGAPVVKGAAPQVRAPNRPSDTDARVRKTAVAQAALVMRAAEMAVPRTANDILTLLEGHRPDPALLAKNRAILDQPVPANASRSESAVAHRQRALAAEALALPTVQIAELRAAIAETDSGTMPAWHLNHELYHALRLYGSFADAIAIKRESVQMNMPFGAHVADLLALADIYADTGNIEESRALLRQAEQAVSSMESGGPGGGFRSGGGGKFAAGGRRGQGDPGGRADRAAYHRADIGRSRGVLLLAEGRYPESEESFRRARDLRKAQLQGGNAVIDDDAISGERKLGTLERSEQGIAQALEMQGRLIEAEYWARQVLVEVLERLGPESTRAVHYVRFLAAILNEQGRFADAEKLLRWSMATLEASGASRESHTSALVVRDLAVSYVGLRRWKEAANLYDQMRRALASQDELTASVLKSYAWPQALYQSGRAAEAVELLEWNTKLRERTAASASDRVLAETRGFLAIALHRAKRNAESLAQFSLAIPALIGKSPVMSEEQGGAVGQVRRARLIVDEYIALLYEMRDSYPGGSDAARDEAFRVSDDARERTTQVALAAAAIRYAVDTPELAGAVRELQDAEQRLAAARSALSRQLGMADSAQDRKAVNDLRAAIASLEKQGASLGAGLERRFPSYASLTTPKPATISEARRALRQGEALVNVLVGPARTTIWIVPANGPARWTSVESGENEIRALVTKLRTAVDPGDVSIEQVPEFDVASAARLYDLLLRPFEAELAGANTLVVAANGALAEIPFAVLVTQAAPVPPATLRFAGYRNVAWLARRFAIAQLPSVNTLVTLRSLPAPRGERMAYAGFGDPRFTAAPVARTLPDAAFTKRNLTLRRVSDGSGDPGWIPYGELPPLPDTREEVISLAIALKADPVSDVFVGAAASKGNVESTDLAHRRIVAFATHGLLAGDFPGLDQPALALSANNDAQSGLLTLEDILALKLEADWVVLSACNSGAGNGNGAEAISGLGRGFFYAGARSLLVTHWPVETRAARKLVSEVFRTYTREPSTTRAQALRAAMLAVMDGPAALDPRTQEPLYSYAHPIFWAPYALVGDGAR